MRAIAVTIALVVSILVSQDAVAVVKPSRVRADLNTKLSALICSNANLNAPTAAWKLGVFDAQISGQKIVKTSGGTLGASDLEATAQALADQHNHRGVSYGTCPDGSGWVASLPAPQPIQMLTKNALQIPSLALANECQKVRVDFAAAKGGRPRNIRLPALKQTQKDLSININFLSDGVLSVVCLPKQPAWQGNTLWSLVPIKRGPAAAPPFAKKFANNKLPDPKKFLAWINAVREQEHLSPLTFSQHRATSAATKLLASTMTINHDRTQLKTVTKELAQAKIKFIGENRVMGSSTAELYWLLWNSPPHRELLLSPRANTLALAIEPQDNRYFAVLMFANETTKASKPAIPSKVKSKSKK